MPTLSDNIDFVFAMYATDGTAATGLASFTLTLQEPDGDAVSGVSVAEIASGLYRATKAAAWGVAGAWTFIAAHAGAVTSIGAISIDAAALTVAAVRSEMDSNSTKLASIETDTQDIQTRIPAALVSGRMASDAVAISGSTTAADNVEANIGNLDAAVSTRLATAGYTAPDNAGIAAVQAQTDLLSFTGTDVKATLDGETVAVASIAANAVNASALATDAVTEITAAILDAVAADYNDPGTIGEAINDAASGGSAPTAAEIRAEIDANSTKLDVAVSTRLASGSVTVGSIAANAITASALAADAGTEITGAILNATAASYNAAGTIGERINDAGAGGDPLTNPVPGDYAVGQAGYQLGRIGSVDVGITAPVATTGTITVYQGKDYAIADNTHLSFSTTSGLALNTATVTLDVNDEQFAATVTGSAGAWTVKVPLTAEETAALPVGVYPYELVAELANGRTPPPLAAGTMRVLAER